MIDLFYFIIIFGVVVIVFTTFSFLVREFFWSRQQYGVMMGGFGIAMGIVIWAMLSNQGYVLSFTGNQSGTELIPFTLEKEDREVVSEVVTVEAPSGVDPGLQDEYRIDDEYVLRITRRGADMIDTGDIMITGTLEVVEKRASQAQPEPTPTDDVFSVDLSLEDI